jgi:hypothetical protein
MQITMLAKFLLALSALAGIATAATVPQAPCFGETYRCDSTLYKVEVCNPTSGWTLQALCGKPSCAVDLDQKVPHCYDY